MARALLIAVVGVMAGVNVCLDFTRNNSFSDLGLNEFLAMVAVAIATASPALVALLVARKTKFRIAGISLYRLAADLVLGLSLVAWFYLLFIRERPEFYPGASHLYPATWPMLLGFIAIVFVRSVSVSSFRKLDGMPELFRGWQ